MPPPELSWGICDNATLSGTIHYTSITTTTTTTTTPTTYTPPPPPTATTPLSSLFLLLLFLLFLLLLLDVTCLLHSPSGFESIPLLVVVSSGSGGS